MSEIKEIGSIEFGIMSKEEILRLSVADIHKNRLCMGKENYNFVMNGLYDPRMGPMEKKVKCVTCGHDSKTCNGHFGSIRLNIEVIHPLYYRTILSFLKCFCINCSRLLITEHHIQLWNLTKQTKEFRFNSILKRIVKLKFCLHCNMSQPKFTLSAQEGVFIASFKNGPTVEKLRLSTTELCKILNNITDDDVRLLGFDPSRMHPKNFILSVLPVLPPRSRPYIVNDNMISDDDITISLCEIIKANNNLNNEKISDAKREKYIQTLKFRIKTMFDNTGNKAKHTNSRPLKGSRKGYVVRRDWFEVTCWVSEWILAPERLLDLTQRYVEMRLRSRLRSLRL
jgi:DNA-directed RNA polymerase subunit A'